MQTVSRLITTFQPEHYNLSIEIDRTAKTFAGTVSIKGTSSIDGGLRLHAKDLIIETALVDGRSADFSHEENDELVIRQDDMQPGKHVVVVGFHGIITDPMHGMYPCNFVHDGQKKQLIATQLESHHAREVFPCVDEPEAKATFDVTLTTEQNVTVLGNMPVKNQRVENDKLVTSFETTPRMSSYLLAWVYGELHKKSARTKSGVEVNVWATPAQDPKSLDFALEIATEAIEFFNDYFGTPYPLSKCDHVALPDFSSGAMENWGLITYREVALLAKPGDVSISSKQRIATVIAHELSHQWFGNLVTMKWWNNLWLNESFANLMEYVAIDAIRPEWHMWNEFSSYETVMALRRDAIDGVQPVQLDVNHPDEISTLFDPAIVYAKGARLMRMLERYMGTADFRKGLQTYFTQFAYQNTEADDLWSHLSSASGKDINGLMQAWISQPGYPVVSVDENGVSQEQFFVGPHEKSDRLWPIPLEANDPALPALLEEKELSASLSPGVRLNSDDSAHFITHYASAFLDYLITAVKSGDASPIQRLQLLDEQTLLARGGHLASADLIPLLDAYRDEKEESVWDIMAVAVGELKKFVETDEGAEKALRKFTGELAAKEYERLGWEMADGESESDTKLRSLIIGLMLYSEKPEVIDEATARYTSTSIDQLDPELRSLIISTVIRHQTVPEAFEDLVKLYKKTTSAELQQDICAGLTSTKSSDEITTLLEMMKDSDSVRPQDVSRWFVYLIRNRDGRTLTWEWMKENWAWIEKTFAGDKSFDDYPRYAATGLVTRDQLEDYKKFFVPKREIPALTRVIDMGMSEIEGRVDLIERDQAAVQAALLKR